MNVYPTSEDHINDLNRQIDRLIMDRRVSKREIEMLRSERDRYREALEKVLYLGRGYIAKVARDALKAGKEGV